MLTQDGMCFARRDGSPANACLLHVTGYADSRCVACVQARMRTRKSVLVLAWWSCTLHWPTRAPLLCQPSSSS
jgi:hypothetical protein